jgi:RNA polymerase sigma-70 factor, ECF subfamily
LIIDPNGDAPEAARGSGFISDECLIKLAKQGDQTAFDELMRRSYGLCLRLAVRLLRDPQDANDEVQNAFWRAYRHLDTFDQRAKFSTWVGRIVINQCRARLRRGQNHRMVSYDAPRGDPGAPLLLNRVVEKEDPEKQFGRAEVQQLIRLEVRRIPKLLRTPLELHHLYGLTVEEVAGYLGISVPATKSRLNRGYRFMRERMNRHLGYRGPATLAA